MKQTLLISFFIIIATVGSNAQTFVYHPNNPNFGGNTFNYSWLLSQAQAQDRNTDPSAASRSVSNGAATGNSASSFAQSLQSQLLSRITSSLIGSQFGEGTLKPGTYKFGDYQVDISNGTTGVVVRIIDGKGGETSITVPYY